MLKNLEKVHFLNDDRSKKNRSAGVTLTFFVINAETIFYIFSTTE